MPPLDNEQDPQLEDGDDLEQEGQGQGGGGGEKIPAWARTLNENVSGLTGTMRQLMDAAATEQRARAQQQPSGDDEPEEPADEDLEVMSRGDFGKHIVSQVLKAVNKNVVEPLSQQIAEITARTTRNDIHGAVKELQGKHKDFDDWRPEMIALANENRGLAPHRLYQLARLDNPDKAKKLDTKYNPPARVERPRLAFGGMTPSQSGTGSRSQKMNPKEASNVAWAETVAALGGEPVFGGDDD